MTKHILEGWDIVVLDNNADSLITAARLLKAYGASVHTATNGHEGLEVVRRVRPRLIISDLALPEADGWAFIHHLHMEPPPLRDIPVIALTKQTSREERKRAMGAGFHDYLTKPLTDDKIINNLVALLSEIPSLAMYLHRT